MVFDKRISLIEQDIEKYLRMVKQIFSSLKKSMENDDFDGIESNILFDKKIDSKYMEIFDDAVWLICRERPLASDLRKILALIFLIRELERCADGAKNICKDIMKFRISSPNKYFKYLNTLIIANLNQINALSELLKNYDVQKSIKIFEEDKKVNKEFDRLVNLVKKKSIEDKNNKIEFYENILFMLYTLEKSADNLAAVASEIFYIEKGYHYE